MEVSIPLRKVSREGGAGEASGPGSRFHSTKEGFKGIWLGSPPIALTFRFHSTKEGFKEYAAAPEGIDRRSFHSTKEGFKGHDYHAHFNGSPPVSIPLRKVSRKELEGYGPDEMGVSIPLRKVSRGGRYPRTSEGLHVSIPLRKVSRFGCRS